MGKILLDLLPISEDIEPLAAYIHTNFNRIQDAIEAFSNNSVFSTNFWTTATLDNLWTAAGGYQTPQYAKTADNLVRLRGAVSAGTLGTSCITLPVGLRPGTLDVFPTTDANRIEVTTSGLVIPYGGVNTLVSLNGVIFAAE